MKLEAEIKSVVEDGGELSIIIRGWFETDPAGTLSRSLGTIMAPDTSRNRKAFHVGRKLKIEVKPS